MTWVDKAWHEPEIPDDEASCLSTNSEGTDSECKPPSLILREESDSEASSWMPGCSIFSLADSQELLPDLVDDNPNSAKDDFEDGSLCESTSPSTRLHSKLLLANENECVAPPAIIQFNSSLQEEESPLDMISSGLEEGDMSSAEAISSESTSPSLDRLQKVKEEHDLAKAVKSDDAEVGACLTLES